MEREDDDYCDQKRERRSIWRAIRAVEDAVEVK